MESIPVKILREGALLPAYGSPEAAGADLYACLEASVTIEPERRPLFPPALPWKYPKVVRD